MTYCIGIKTNEGLVFASDSRTNAGLDNVNIYSKMFTHESEDLGTDFYDSDLKLTKTLPYKDNYGYFFSSGPDTWHGMEKKEIVKERRCLQVNYVTFKTDWKVED